MFLTVATVASVVVTGVCLALLVLSLVTPTCSSLEEGAVQLSRDMVCRGATCVDLVLPHKEYDDDEGCPESGDVLVVMNTRRPEGYASRLLSMDELKIMVPEEHTAMMREMLDDILAKANNGPEAVREAQG